MTSIATLSEFLLQAGSNFLIFDLGRGVHRLSGQQLLNIESGLAPCPYPRQGQMWLAVVFWEPGRSQQHYVWFLRFNLDEQGLLIAAQRDHFMQLVVDALQQQSSETATASVELADNPYAFTPSTQLMADFNAICRRQLELPASSHLAPVVAMFRSGDFSNWELQALQGLADFCVRLDEGDHTSLIARQLHHLPAPLLCALCASMEHQPLPAAISTALQQMLGEKQFEAHRGAILRALSKTESSAALDATLINTIKGARDLDIMSVVAARHWGRLTNPQLLGAYFEQLAQHFEPPVMAGLFMDLVRVPSLRERMLGFIQSDDCPEALLSALRQQVTPQ